MSASANAATPPRDAPRKPQQLDKRVRLSRCIGRLRLPTDSGRAELTVQCQLEKHDNQVAHEHRGFVFMNDGTARQFTLTWYDEGVAHPYMQAHIDRTHKPKPTKLAKIERLVASKDTHGNNHTTNTSASTSANANE